MFELTPYGVDYLKCKQCANLMIDADRFICGVNRCTRPPQIEYYEFKCRCQESRVISPSTEDNFSMVCPECEGEMWGSKERGFICTLCGKEIKGEIQEDIQEEMMLIE